ncbi:MAG: phage capsid protein [Flavobacteriaceae bacterium]
MSTEITTAFVEQYKANVAMLAQQKASRLRRAVMEESVTGTRAFFEQIGPTEMIARTTRHGDSPLVSTPHDRRAVTLTDYHWGDMVDDQDKVRLLIDPTSPYAQNAAMAANRKIDEVIIQAADATAYTGVDGTVATSFDAAMIVDVQTRDVGVSAADLGMNVAKIIEAGRLLAANEVDEDEEKFIVWNARQRASLLNSTKATSADYAAVKALVTGQMNEFLGFTFIRSERIGTDANGDDKVLFFARSGIRLGIGMSPKTRIAERPDKEFNTYVYTAMSIGATRMEEAKVGYIECDPTAGPGA